VFIIVLLARPEGLAGATFQRRVYWIRKQHKCARAA
jgi:hypothetical protein